MILPHFDFFLMTLLRTQTFESEFYEFLEKAILIFKQTQVMSHVVLCFNWNWNHSVNSWIIDFIMSWKINSDDLIWIKMNVGYLTRVV